MTPLIIVYLVALGLSIAVEAAVAVVFFRKHSHKRVLLAAILGTAISHPLLHFVWPHVISPHASPDAFIISGEFGAFLIEAVVYYKMLRLKRWRLAFAGSALANLASFSVGLLLF